MAQEGCQCWAIWSRPRKYVSWMQDCKIQNWTPRCWSTDCHQRISSAFKEFLLRLNCKNKVLIFRTLSALISPDRPACLATEIAPQRQPDAFLRQQKALCVFTAELTYVGQRESQTGQKCFLWEHKLNRFLYLQQEECRPGPISVAIHHLSSNPSH